MTSSYQVNRQRPDIKPYRNLTPDEFKALNKRKHAFARELKSLRQRELEHYVSYDDIEELLAEVADWQDNEYKMGVQWALAEIVKRNEDSDE